MNSTINIKLTPTFRTTLATMAGRCAEINGKRILKIPFEADISTMLDIFVALRKLCQEANDEAKFTESRLYADALRSIDKQIDGMSDIIHTAINSSGFRV